MLYEDGIEDQPPLSLVPGMVVYPPDVSGGGRLVVGDGSGGNGQVGMVGGSQPKLIFVIATAQTLTLLVTERRKLTLTAPAHCSLRMVSPLGEQVANCRHIEPSFMVNSRITWTVTSACITIEVMVNPPPGLEMVGTLSPPAPSKAVIAFPPSCKAPLTIPSTQVKPEKSQPPKKSIAPSMRPIKSKPPCCSGVQSGGVLPGTGKQAGGCPPSPPQHY